MTVRRAGLKTTLGIRLLGAGTWEEVFFVDICSSSGEWGNSYTGEWLQVLRKENAEMGTE